MDIQARQLTTKSLKYCKAREPIPRDLKDGTQTDVRGDTLIAILKSLTYNEPTRSALVLELTSIFLFRSVTRSYKFE